MRQFIEGEEYPYVTMELTGNTALNDRMGYYRFLEAAGAVPKHREFMVKPDEWGHNKNCTLYMWNNVPSGDAATASRHRQRAAGDQVQSGPERQHHYLGVGRI